MLALLMGDAAKASALEQIAFGSVRPIVAALGSSAGRAVQRASGRRPSIDGLRTAPTKPIRWNCNALWKPGNDSEMAPQAIEISQNGGDP